MRVFSEACGPDSYYTRAKAHFPRKTFAFSEIAWSSGGLEYGGTEEEEEQVAFLRRSFEELTPALRKEFVLWFELNDLQGGPGEDGAAGSIDSYEVGLRRCKRQAAVAGAVSEPLPWPRAKLG